MFGQFTADMPVGLPLVNDKEPISALPVCNSTLNVSVCPAAENVDGLAPVIDTVVAVCAKAPKGKRSAARINKPAKACLLRNRPRKARRPSGRHPSSNISISPDLASETRYAHREVYGYSELWSLKIFWDLSERFCITAPPNQKKRPPQRWPFSFRSETQLISRGASQSQRPNHPVISPS